MVARNYAWLQSVIFDSKQHFVNALLWKKICTEIQYKKHTWCLVGVGKTTHAAHDAQHVVVHRVDADRRGQHGADRVVGQGEQQRRVIDTREVAAA